MTDRISRREFCQALGIGAAVTALVEGGGPASAWAEDRFTVASTGGSFGDGVRDDFVAKSGFEKKHNAKVAYSHQLESVAASKVMASCGTPVLSVSSHGQAEAALMADGGCLQAYDLEMIPNYGDLFPTATLESRQGMKAWYASVHVAPFGLTWNTKHGKKPSAYKDMWDPSYRGRVGVPAYGWYGMYWLHAVNKLFGGNEDNISPGMQAVADLVKKNQAQIVENVDHGIKLFQREEVVIMPFWSGRTFAMQDAGTPAAIEYVEGSVPVLTAFVITRGTQFRELANRFVNVTLDPDLQLEWTRRFKYPPTNRKAKLPPDLERVRIPEPALERMARLDWKRINDHRAAYLERWNKEVLG